MEEYEKQLKRKLSWIISPSILATIFFSAYIPIMIVIPLIVTSAICIYLFFVNFIRCPECKSIHSKGKWIQNDMVCKKCGFEFDLEKKQAMRARVKKLNPHLPEAAHLNWTPLNITHATYDQGKLKKISDKVLKFKTHKLLMLTSLIFPALGFWILGIFLNQLILMSKFNLLALLVGLLFLLPLLVIFLSPSSSIFDKNNDTFSKGSHKIQLSEIKGLQTLEESRWKNIQLNLILNNNRRENVMIYAKPENALRDAEYLADFLSVKLWRGV